MKRGRIIFLYGLTSCGKTSAADRMRDMCDSVLFCSSNDIFHDMISGKFFAEDFWREVARTIGAQYYAVRAMAEAGFDAAVDGMLLDLPEYRELFGMSNLEMVQTLFAPYDPLFVRFECPPEELRRRNLARGDRGEFQSDEQAALMTKDPPADLVIDAMTVFPDEAAAMILDAAGLPWHPTENDEDRALLLKSVLYPLTPEIRPGTADPSLRRHPNRITTEVRTGSDEETDAVVRELTRRGYARAVRPTEGFAVLTREREGMVTETCRVSADDRFDDLSPRLGELVRVRVDRPAGSRHPEHPDMVYPTPYGFLPGSLSADGEETDAYLAGFGEELYLRAGDEVFGTVAAVVYRADDREEKLIVAPPNVFPSPEDLTAAAAFTERYFLSTLLLPEKNREKSCGCILFRMTDGSPEVLLIRESSGSVWGFPKGHMLPGEAPEDTAAREVREEVGLTPDARDFLREADEDTERWSRSESYDIAGGRAKDVLYFLAPAPRDWTPSFPDGEANRAVWIGPGDDLTPYGLRPERRTILGDAFQTIDDMIG